ncbi:YybH family protein [Spirosoma aerolatum]|uniref:YybH family protein n=1 Tax=Spirosoma aerolatum TaxID=1211326 RepID=UPI0009AC2DC0|nr:nuclear transport factor 2 family protein [Spirosoma aerolatum]
MRLRITLFILSLFFETGVRAQSIGTAPDRRAILQILKRQTDDWNAGRIDKFMTAYWVSDSLTFVGKAGITYGYQATLENYKKRYPDRAAMGKLRFDVLNMDFPSPNVAYVIGRFHLTRPKIGDANGYFTLLWHKVKRRWVIISDHTS